MKRRLKESHFLVIFTAVSFTICTIFYQVVAISSFDELDYIKGTLVDKDYKKQFITLNTAEHGDITLNLTCINSEIIIAELECGVELEVWYEIIWWPFKPEIWELKKENVLVCSYQARLKRLRITIIIGFILSIVLWCFAFVQYHQRRSKGE